MNYDTDQEFWFCNQKQVDDTKLLPSLSNLNIGQNKSPSSAKLCLWAFAYETLPPHRGRHTCSPPQPSQTRLWARQNLSWGWRI
jgi:hypothetical protein